MSVTKSYSIAYLNLQVECEDEPLCKKVISALDEFFFLNKTDSCNDAPHVILKFKQKTAPFQQPENVQSIFTSPRLNIFKNGNVCYLAGQTSFFHLELADCKGTGYLDRKFWDMPPKLQQEFLMLAFLWLFHKHGLYAIHGNALVRDECGIFIVGDTCSGKSTTALSLIRQGWNYLSDDVTLLKQDSQGVTAVAFQKGFSFDPHLASHYSELEKNLKSSSFNGKKRFLDISKIYSDRFQPDCIPKAIIFPKIVSEDRSRLIPLDKTTSLTKLMQNSGGIMVDKEMVAQQVEVLKTLIFQASGYQLLAARDLYDEPQKISEVLSEAKMI